MPSLAIEESYRESLYLRGNLSGLLINAHHSVRILTHVLGL
jgi:hypothetical protein